MEVKKLFDGVFRVDGWLATRNLAKGRAVYGERLLDDAQTQYRTWDPYRSKLAAAINKGMKTMQIAAGAKVLYLGAATGTTCSHVSDIVGEDGTVFCVEHSERNMRELLKVCESRENMLPIAQDARRVESYADDVGAADVLYQDVSARDQAMILLFNSRLLKPRGYAYVAIKSQSIDVAKNPKLVYKEFLAEVAKEFELLEAIDIMPYDKAHLFVVLRKKSAGKAANAEGLANRRTMHA